MPIIGLESEWVGSRVPGSKLIDQCGAEHMSFIQRQTLGSESCVLNTSYLRTKIEFLGCGRRGR